MSPTVSGSDAKPDPQRSPTGGGDSDFNQAAISGEPKRSVKYLSLGGIPAQLHLKMQEFARQEGLDVDASMRGLLFRALTELKPIVPEDVRTLADVKGEWRTIPTGKDTSIQRFFVTIELKESHQSLVDAWTSFLRGAVDRYQMHLLPATNGGIPICLHQDNPKLPQFLKALSITSAALPAVEHSALDIISPDDVAAGVSPPPVRLLAPEDVLTFINRSPTFLEAIRAPIEAARRKYGSSFAGVDANCKSLNESQVRLIERLKASCEKLIAEKEKERPLGKKVSERPSAG